MLLQTNSYIVPPEQRAAHARLIEQFRQTMQRLGCDSLEIYEQVGANWDAAARTGRFVQILRFRDREHQLAVQAAERQDKEAQELISHFCPALINFPYQQEHGYFAVGFYADIDANQSEADESAAQAPQPISKSSKQTEEEEKAYLDRDLDSLVDDLGVLPLRITPEESEPQEMDLLEELEDHTEPANCHAAEAHKEDAEFAGLGQVLDAGMDDESLDEEMPAELLDDEDIESPGAKR